MSNLVRSYSVGSEDNSNYKLTFEIPDNCEYSVSGSNGVYTIFVTLQHGETEPSSIYIPCEEELLCDKGEILIEFEQEGSIKCDENALKRPIIRISFV